MSWKIIGTTLATEESLLPRRLPPVFEGDGGRLVVSIGGGNDIPEGDNDDRFGEVSEGDVYRFDVPLEPLSDHVLVRVHQDSDPELVPLDRADARASELAWEALGACARELIVRGTASAMAHGWYAVRARPDEALPWLVVMALMRREGEDEDAQLFEERVKRRVEGLPSDLEEALAEARGARTSLIMLLIDDAFAGRWFDHMPSAGPKRPNALRIWRNAIGVSGSPQ